jgi:glycosyltransferase involved in cell wall biosynthesis
MTYKLIHNGEILIHIRYLLNFMIKKSITVICHSLGCGGTEKVLTNIVYYYSKKNIETTIITLGSVKLFSGLKLSKKTKIIELKAKYSNNVFIKITNILNWIFSLNKYIRKNKNSIYLSFLPIPNILTVISSMNINITHYGSERNNPNFTKPPKHWKFLRFITYRKMNGLIVQTKEIKKYFLNYLPENKIHIIPNSVMKIIYNNNLEEFNAKKLKVLFIGRLEYQKGVDIIIDAIIKIFNSKNKDKFTFEIVGNGSLAQLVEYNIKKNNLTKYVKFTKGSDNPNKYIKESHIILHPSRYEGMANVVLEAMSYGKCVISTKQSSSEIIKNNKDGILMKSISISEIISCLETLSINRKLLKDISSNAIKKINQNYSEEKIFKLWSKILKINK